MEKVESFTAPAETKEVATKGSVKPVKKEESKGAPPVEEKKIEVNKDKNFATDMVNTSLNIESPKKGAIPDQPKESKSKTDRNMPAKEEEQKRTIQTNQKSKVDKAVHEAYSVGPTGSIKSKKGSSAHNVTINTASTIDAQNDLPIAKELAQLNKQGQAVDPNSISSEPKGSPMPIKDPTVQRQKPAPI